MELVVISLPVSKAVNCFQGKLMGGKLPPAFDIRKGETIKVFFLPTQADEVASLSKGQQIRVHNPHLNPCLGKASVVAREGSIVKV